MPLDPVLAGVLSLMEQSGNPAMSEGTPAQARQLFQNLVGMLSAAFPDGPRTPVGAVLDTTIPGPAGPLPVRVYRPADSTGPLPTVVMLHGGGWVIGDIETYDDDARQLCAGVGAVVVSVEYRLAPESPYPAARDDAVAATRYVLDHVEDFGGDAERVGVAGDSAGGNLAAVVTQALQGAPASHPIRAQLLFYPGTDALDSEGTYPSRTENATGYFLTADDMRWFIDHYAPDGVDRGQIGLSPLRNTDLAGLPAAVVATAEFDPLRDEGEAYAEALARAGVHVVARRFDGLIHGFAGMGAISPACQQAADESFAEFAKLLT